jgi:hypothetical protein
MVPLTSLTSRKVKFEWHSSHQQEFDKINKVIGAELLLFNPDFNKLFHLDTDESDHHIIISSYHKSGAIIMQDESPIKNRLLFARV